MASKSQPQITLLPATESDLAAAIDLQYQCFGDSALVEWLTNPDTPENRANMLKRHQQHIREDAGLRMVKAIARTDDADPETEAFIGFCMFYLPIPSPTDPGTWILPIPIRAAFDGTTKTPAPATATSAAAAVASMAAPGSDVPSVVEPDPATASTTIPSSSITTAAPEEQILANGMSISRTNLPHLSTQRLSDLHTHVTHLASSSNQNPSSSKSFPPPIGYVRYMCVHPSWRRHGVGRRLMEWGCDLFDAHGVDAYLAATALGESLYRLYGFERISAMVLEIDAVEVQRYSCMWRDAVWRRRTAGGVQG